MNIHHKKKSLILLFALQIIIQGIQAQESKTYHLLIGTYTRGKSEGIYVFSFDAKKGEVNYQHTIKGISNPNYLDISPNRNFVYSVTTDTTDPGSVIAFAFNRQTGMLSFLNKQSSGGKGPCYVSVDGTGKFVFVGNYAGGSLAALPVLPDGSLGEAGQNIIHQGSSINKERQDRPHVHATVLTPDNKYLMVPDLGLDKVMVYNFTPANTDHPLTPANPPFAALTPGSGPRHLVFHPNGKFAYVVQEITGFITAFTYAKGSLRTLQSITMLPAGFNGKIGAADIHVSPDGKFLYASNRGEANEIVIYSIHPKSGVLTYAGRQSTGGKTPRNFAIDPTGNFLLAGNENSDHIVIFKRNLSTGLLSDTGKHIEVGAPVCIKFVAKD